LTRITWDAIGERRYESGVDRGVLYVEGLDGVAWNGLTQVAEKPSGGAPQPYYIDGQKFVHTSAAEDFAATLGALTYPDEFDACDGYAEYNIGMYLTGQPRKQFGLSYRSMVATDANSGEGYKVHIVYGALVSPAERDHQTETNAVTPMPFGWDIQTVPQAAAGFKPTAHVVLDSRLMKGLALAAIEDILYGTDSNAPRLPAVAEVSSTIDSFADLKVTDYGDGSATIDGIGVTVIDANTYHIDWPSVVALDANTYQISSL